MCCSKISRSESEETKNIVIKKWKKKLLFLNNNKRNDLLTLLVSVDCASLFVIIFLFFLSIKLLLHLFVLHIFYTKPYKHSIKKQ